jgi:hypothetical protein
MNFDSVKEFITKIKVPFRCPYCLIFKREANEIIEHIAAYHFLELKKTFDKLYLPEDEMIQINMNTNDVLFEISTNTIKQPVNSSMQITNQILKNTSDKPEALLNSVSSIQQSYSPLKLLIKNTNEYNFDTSNEVLKISSNSFQSITPNLLLNVPRNLDLVPETQKVPIIADKEVEVGYQMSNVKYCKICKKSFATLCYIQKHLSLVHKITNFEIIQANILERTKKTFKKLKKPISCKICNKSLMTTNTLNKHLRNKHDKHQ